MSKDDKEHPSGPEEDCRCRKLYSEEILFQSGVHPRRKCNDLSKEKMDNPLRKNTGSTSEGHRLRGKLRQTPLNVVDSPPFSERGTSVTWQSN